MWKRFGTWWIDDLFGPQRKSMFLLRIRARVLKLRLLLWWRRPKATMIRHHWPKPVALLLVGVLVPILTGWLLSTAFPDEARGFSIAVENLLTNPDRFALEWREAAQILLLLVGVPSAFLLWLFRDINVSGTLENQRKDVNLKEFQEIQMRAAGAMDEKLPGAARETLQIAALHQLRAFLRGEYGKSFQRPALELLRARLVVSAQVTGTQAVHSWLTKWRTATDVSLPDPGGRIAKLNHEVSQASRALRPSIVAGTEQSILLEEWQAIFRSEMPLRGSVFDAITLPDDVLLAELDLADCRFIFALLRGVHLERTNLSGADFAHANLYSAHLEGAKLDWAQLQGADLGHARLERGSMQMAHLEGAGLSSACLDYADLTLANLDGASLEWASLKGATLSGALLRGANLVGAKLEGACLDRTILDGATLEGVAPTSLATCAGAWFDAATKFAADWDRLSERKRTAARQPWIEQGAGYRAPAP